MLRQCKYILEMIRFSHTLFALPFALLAAVMAWTTETVDGRSVAFRGETLLGILLCMVFARSAAMAFNRLLDRHLDAANPRTSQRHLPAGILTVRSVTLFAAINSLGFIASTLLFWPNRLPLFLAIPILAFLFGYSYTKRFTSLAHFWLGMALMLAPVSAWIAVRGEILLDRPDDLWPALTLGMSVLLWVAGFDVIYACQDMEYDRQARLHSIPASLGIVGALRVAALCHLGMVILLVTLPFIVTELGWIYWSGISAVALLLVYEHWMVRPDDLTKVNMAFFRVNSIVSVGLFCICSLDLLT